MSHHFWPYTIDADEAPPLDADRYLVWLARHQWRTILGGVLFGVPWMLSIALVPAAIGKAIDGLVAHDEKALLVWSGAIMGLGLISAVTTDGRHWFAVRNWLIASFRTAVVTERAVRRAGPALTRRMPAGEVVTSFASDFWRIGNAYDVTARMAGAIVSFLGGHTQNEALLFKNEAVLKKAEASNQWNYYQAKSTKQALAEFAAGLATDPAKADKYRASVERYEKEKAEIRKEAEALEKQSREANEHSEHALHPHHYLAISMTLLQIAIALASITVLTQKRWLLYGAAFSAFAGAVLGIAAWF